MLVDLKDQEKGSRHLLITNKRRWFLVLYGLWAPCVSLVEVYVHKECDVAKDAVKKHSFIVLAMVLKKQPISLNVLKLLPENHKIS